MLIPGVLGPVHGIEIISLMSRLALDRAIPLVEVVQL